MIIAGYSMSSHTDDSTLPSSTVDSSGSDTSSQSVSSSNEHVNQSLDFVNYSWPLSRDRQGMTFNADELENIDLTSGRNDIFPRWSDLQSARKDDFRPISRNSSTQNSPRTRQNHTPSPRGCSPDASALYSNTGKHYNPSGSGQRACQEILEYRDWANGYLQYCPHNTLITDLTRDLADGQTLLHLVEVLLGVSMYPTHVKPALRVQRTENIQKCLDVLTRHCVLVHDISAKDVVEANTKTILALCKYLKQHFGPSPDFPKGSSGFATSNRQTPSNRIKPECKSRTVSPRVSPNGTIGTPDPPSKSFSLIDIEDVAVLDWVCQLTGQMVDDYHSFQDGHILCLLINKLTDGAVPDVVLDYGLPSEKVSLAVKFAEEELGVTTDLHPDDVVNLKNGFKLSSFLKELHCVFLEQVQEKEQYMEIQKINKLVQNYRELNKETENERRNSMDFALHLDIRNNEDDSLLPIPSETTSSFSPSLPKVKSLGKSKEKKCLGETGFCVHLQDGVNEIPRDDPLSNGIEDASYYLEELSDMENPYRNSRSFTPVRHPFHAVKPSLNNSLNKPSPRRKLDAVPYFEGDIMQGLLPQESVFDSEMWKYPYKIPHAAKSWQKERENAKLQLSDISSQLQHVKEEYFRLMNMKIQQTPLEHSTMKTSDYLSSELPTDEDWGLNTDSSQCVDKEGNRSTTAEKHVTKTDKILSDKLSGSSSVMAYMNVKKGTLPPYRTWSRYENTEGERYPCYTKKKTRLQKKQNTVSKAHSPRLAVESQDWNGSRVKTAGRHENQAHAGKMDFDKTLISSQKKQVEKIKSLDSDSEESVISTKVSGRHLCGMTALVRLSSKKANAVSDTDSYH